MAPKKGKRSVPEQKLAPTLKKFQVAPGSFRQLSEALHHPFAELNEECREMLVAGLPFSVCVFQDQRHEVQEAVVSMLEQAMSKILGGMQVALDQENQKVTGAEATREELEQKVQAAQEALKASQAVVEANASAMQVASQELVEAKSALGSREREQREGDVELNQLVASKELLETSRETFQVLKLEGGKLSYKKFEPALKLLEMEQSLCTAVPGVLTRSPGERGSFDSTVIEELEKTLQAKVTQLAQGAEALRPQSAARLCAVERSRLELAAAEEKQQKASNELIASKEAQKAAALGVSKAKDAATAYRNDYSSVTKARDEKQEELQGFVDGALATFQELKVRCKKRKVEDLGPAP